MKLHGYPEERDGYECPERRARMYNSTAIKELKRIDPIWKRLRFVRIWKLLFLVFMVFYIFYSASDFWQRQGASSIFTFFILSFGVVFATINQFRQERYWKRVGMRRREALHDMQPFVASDQPGPQGNALSLPVTIRLRWNRTILAVGGGLILLVLCLTLVAVLVASPRNSIQTSLLVVGIVALIFVLGALPSYFLMMRYQPQEIELTEYGIKTWYMGQVRSMHWDEARIFAEYEARGVNKSLL